MSLELFLQNCFVVFVHQSLKYFLLYFILPWTLNLCLCLFLDCYPNMVNYSNV